MCCIWCCHIIFLVPDNICMICINTYMYDKIYTWQSLQDQLILPIYKVVYLIHCYLFYNFWKNKLILTCVCCNITSVGFASWDSTTLYIGETCSILALLEVFYFYPSFPVASVLRRAEAIIHTFGKWCCRQRRQTRKKYSLLIDISIEQSFITTVSL